MEQRPILAAAQRLVILQRLARANLLQDALLLGAAILRYDQRERFSNRLFCGIAIEAEGAAVPTFDRAVKVGAENRVIRMLNDCGQARSARFHIFSLRDIDED